MGDDDGGVVGPLELVDPGGHYPQGIHVQAAVSLVEDGQTGLEHGHLEDLVALLLTAGEAYVDASGGERGVHLHDFHLAAHELEEVGGVQGLEALVPAVLVDGGAHEVDVGHAGYLDGVLEAQEEAFERALLGGEVQDVAAVECDFSGGDGVTVPAGQDSREGGFAGTVGAHDRVGLAFADCQVDAAEYFLVAHTCVQVFDFE